MFLYGKWQTYSKWYQVLLINPHSQFRVHRFFIELEMTFKEFDQLVEGLLAPIGHPLTDVKFQLRWLVWWKFFGSRPLQQALKLFNESEFLRIVLQTPSKVYTREIFHTFREKLEKHALEPMMDQLIEKIDAKELLN